MILKIMQQSGNCLMATKSDLAYDHLRNEIISGQIAPDVPLRIQTLGKETGYGSTPVREALRRLESERLVVSAVNCGFRSAAISVPEIKDLDQSRLIIETALLRQSIEAGDDAWEGGIVSAHYQLTKLPLPFDTSSHAEQANWSAKHQQFHEALTAASPSLWLHSFQKQIAEQTERFFHYTMDAALLKRLEHSPDLKALLERALGVEHHTQLMQATLDRDAEAATTLLTEHIQFASQFFAKVFPDN